MVSDEAARAAAKEILSEARFARWDGDFESWLRALEALVDLIPSWLIDVLAWLQHFLLDTLLANLFEFLGRFLGVFGVFGETPALIGWIAVSLILAVAVVLAYRAFGEKWFGLESTPAERLSMSPHTDAIRDAKRLAGEGRFLDAAHRIQLATLSLLIEVDVIELGRSDPNRTLRRRVADSSLPDHERRALVGLVDRLETLWFSEPREDEDLYGEWLALDERMLRIARERAI